ncbi:hypothetical protein [Coxiella endosymbiont of Ornithodoros amblus]|uniref:hypothetical protein n=1 Tax=Coxiella endosymbiont of Ornithodoros amblus TaxID=1656166 RepID=UPI00244E2038|nr:hypothetical protein [Coxiella endosymbiont of Ornithodoros amblus]
MPALAAVTRLLRLPVHPIPGKSISGLGLPKACGLAFASAPLAIPATSGAIDAKGFPAPKKIIEAVSMATLTAPVAPMDAPAERQQKPQARARFT